MKDSESQVAVLFHRYYNGKASVSETERLMKLIDASKDEEALYKLLKKLWDETSIQETHFTNEKSQQILNSILTNGEAKDSERVIPLYRWLKYAAAVLIVLGLAFGTTLWKSYNESRIGTVSNADLEILPGGNKAKLSFADGTVLDLEHLSAGSLVERNGVAISKMAEGKLVYEISASGKLKPEMNTITTPRGGQYEVRLPDGSVAWLNSSSTLRFPTQFSTEERRVSVEGEVYFEIEKEAKRKFKVDFGDNEIEVLGTHFNVMYYPNEGKSETTLTEGTVLLKSHESNNRLKPGQQAQVNTDGSVLIKNVDVHEILAWKNGLFYFKEAGIATVMLKVSRWYDIEVEYEGTPTSRQLNGKVLRSVSINEMMDMLLYAGVKSKIEGRKITIYN